MNVMKLCLSPQDSLECVSRTFRDIQQAISGVIAWVKWFLLQRNAAWDRTKLSKVSNKDKLNPSEGIKRTTSNFANIHIQPVWSERNDEMRTEIIGDICMQSSDLPKKSALSIPTSSRIRTSILLHLLTFHEDKILAKSLADCGTPHPANE
jgi:hypothetical protein